MAAPSSDERLSFTWLSWSPQKGQRISALVDGETRAKGSHAGVHFSLDRTIAFKTIGLQPVEHVRNHVAHFAELGFAKAAGGAGRRADPDSAGLRRRQRIE